MNSKFYLITLSVLVLFSCKNEDKKEVVKTPNPEVKEVKIDIDGLLYESSFDGVRKEGDYDFVTGTYTTNRLGMAKKALSMDGLSESVKVENHDNINPKKGITVSIWYKPISFKGSGNDPIVLKPSDTDGAPFVQYLFGVTGNEYPSPKVKGTFKFALSINGEYVQLSTKKDIWSPDTWYNLTGTYDGERMQFFINGKLENARTITDGKLDVYKTDMLIGRSLDNKTNTPGVYDNLKIYNRALTNEEVALLNK